MQVQRSAVLACQMSMLAKVEALRETAATAVGPVKKAVNADLEVAVHALLRDLAFREVDEAERQSVEETLSTHAQQLKLALLRALGVSALHRALVLQPVLLESMRRMLCTVPHAGAAGILEKALGTDIDVSTDLCAAARATSLRRLPAPPAYGGRALHPLPRPPLARHRLPPLHLTHLLCRWALKCAMQVLDFLQGDGDLKKQLGDGWDQRCAFDHSS